VLHNVFTNPSLLIPSLVFPLFFFTRVRGRALADLAGSRLRLPAGYTAFQFVFVLLQSRAFGGVFTGFGIARDFESGFGGGCSSPRRIARGIVLGYAAAALVRWVVTAACVTVVALSRAWRSAAAGSISSASTRWA
jgi:ABC-2 type transport system permease protein